MNIYTYLRKDHKVVADLFQEIIEASDNTLRERLFLQLKKELELHADPEHETFYKALSKKTKGKEDAEHGDEEHKEIKKALNKLSKISCETETDKWLVQLGELKHIVEHHVEDEEGNMFDDAKKIISDKQAEELAIEMEELKTKLAESKAFSKKYEELNL